MRKESRSGGLPRPARTNSARTGYTAETRGGAHPQPQLSAVTAVSASADVCCPVAWCVVADTPTSRTADRTAAAARAERNAMDLRDMETSGGDGIRGAGIRCPVPGEQMLAHSEASMPDPDGGRDEPCTELPIVGRRLP